MQHRKHFVMIIILKIAGIVQHNHHACCSIIILTLCGDDANPFCVGARISYGCLQKAESLY